MSRKWGHSVTKDDRRTFTKVLGADKAAKMHRDQTLGNNNKDGMFDCSLVPRVLSLPRGRERTLGTRLVCLQKWLSSD